MFPSVLLFLISGVLPAQGVSSDTFEPLQEVLTPRYRSVNFHGLGVFSLAPPFTNTQWLPARPSFIGTTFNLYTRQNPTTPQRIRADRRTSIRGSHFNATLPVKFLIHGFLQHRRSEFLANMTRSLLAYGPMNVIVVGWSGGAGFPYSQAVANTRVVGAEVARMIQVLKVIGVQLDNVHLIGHSLGAQTAGYAGSRTPGLGRITGLDPAQPNFEGYNNDVCLDKTDANFVDVIHTDAVPYDTVGGYGIINPVGHIDFYPNGGHHQPGCHEEPSVFSFFQDAWERGLTSAEYSISCSHERSHKYFTQSITSLHSSCAFRAFPCTDESDFTAGRCSHCGNRPCPLMGYHADKNFGARGSFFLNTTNQSPYCGHHFFVTLTLDPAMEEVDGVIKVKITGENGHTSLRQIASATLTPGEEYTGMILGGAELGHVTSVDVHYEQTSSFLWGERDLAVRKVVVTHAERTPPKYFCGRERTIATGRHIVFRNGSFRPSHCP